MGVTTSIFQLFKKTVLYAILLDVFFVLVSWPFIEGKLVTLQERPTEPLD